MMESMEEKLEKLIEETSELGTEFLLSSSWKKNVLFVLSKPPQHRQGAWWYLQTLATLEILKTLKEIKEVIGKDKCVCPTEKKKPGPKKKGK
jgi:hypothetical protein